jgi:hypothetical protein
MKFRVGRPASGLGGFQKSDHVDHLVCFVEPEEEQVDTMHGRATAARVRYIVCLDDGTIDVDQLVFGAALVPALLDVDDEIVVGRLVQGEAKAGRNPPWLLAVPRDEELEKAGQWFDSYASRVPASGRIVIEATPPRLPVTRAEPVELPPTRSRWDRTGSYEPDPDEPF